MHAPSSARRIVPGISRSSAAVAAAAMAAAAHSAGPMTAPQQLGTAVCQTGGPDLIPAVCAARAPGAAATCSVADACLLHPCSDRSASWMYVCSLIPMPMHRHLRPWRNLVVCNALLGGETCWFNQWHAMLCWGAKPVGSTNGMDVSLAACRLKCYNHPERISSRRSGSRAPS